MYGRSGPLTFWLAVIRAVLPRWVSTQDIGVSLDGHFRLLCPVVDPSGVEWPRRKGASRDGFIGACARSGRPSAGTASRGKLSRTWLPLTVSSGFTCRSLVPHQPDVLNLPVRDHELSSSWRGVRGHSDAVPNKWYIS
jgi:hypothetical protein